MEYIKLLAKRFRDAIECAKENGERDNLHFFLKFPRGCCGDASDLLAKYLSKIELKRFKFVEIILSLLHSHTRGYLQKII